MKYRDQLILLIVLFFSGMNIYSNTKFDKGNIPKISAGSAFVENKGQLGEEVLFSAKMKNVNVILKNDCILYDFYKIVDKDNQNNTVRKQGTVIKMKLIGSVMNSDIKGISAESHTKNFFMGNDRSKWIKNLKEFKIVEYNEVYDNIDMRLSLDNSFPRYDFIVKPGANPGDIKLAFEGGGNLTIDNESGMAFSTEIGTIRNGKIYAYQNINGQKIEVECNFVNGPEGIGFELEDYDSQYELVIDPLVYMSYLGGELDESINAIKTVGENSFVVSGWTESLDFVTTPGTYDSTFSLYKDGFISKFEIEGASCNLIFSTFLGSVDTDIINGMDIDMEGNIFVCGETNSTDFPALESFNIMYNQGYDAFIAKLNPDGNELMFSGFVNGSGEDYAKAIKLDKNGNPHIVGNTDSKDFFVKNGYQMERDGGTDIFVAKLSANGKSLSFSTFVGGDGDDIAYGMDLNEDGYVYVTGETQSTNFPVWPFQSGWGGHIIKKPYDYTYNGGKDAFVFSLVESGTALFFSTYFGGKSGDIGKAVCACDDGSALIVGETEENTEYDTEFPISDNVYAVTHSGGWDCFIAKIEYPKKSNWFSMDQQLLFSTYYGDKLDDFVTGITLIGTPSEILVTGYTRSPKYPIYESPDAKFKGAIDSYATYFTENGAEIIYSTVFGDQSDDVLNAVAFNDRNDLYFGGYTTSKKFTPIGNAYQSEFGGGAMDCMILKLSKGEISIDPFTEDEYCAGSPLTIKWYTKDMHPDDKLSIEYYDPFSEDWEMISEGESGDSYEWDVPVDLTEGDGYLLRLAHSSGIFDVSEVPFSIISPPAEPTVNAFTDDNLIAPPNGDQDYIINICEGGDLKISAAIEGRNLEFQWMHEGAEIDEATDTVFTIAEITHADAGLYTLKAFNGCAPEAISKPVTLIVDSNATITEQPKDTLVKETEPITFTVAAKGTGLGYQWQKDNENIFGETDPEYKIKASYIANEGEYRCIVSGKCSVDTSETATLEVDTTTGEGVYDFGDFESEHFSINVVNTKDNNIHITLESELICNCSIQIVDNFGRRVKTVYNGQIRTGQNEYNANIGALPAGMYWIAAKACNELAVKKLLLIK